MRSCHSLAVGTRNKSSLFESVVTSSVAGVCPRVSHSNNHSGKTIPDNKKMSNRTGDGSKRPKKRNAELGVGPNVSAFIGTSPASVGGEQSRGLGGRIQTPPFCQKDFLQTTQVDDSHLLITRRDVASIFHQTIRRGLEAAIPVKRTIGAGRITSDPRVFGQRPNILCCLVVASVIRIHGSTFPVVFYVKHYALDTMS